MLIFGEIKCGCNLSALAMTCVQFDLAQISTQLGARFSLFGWPHGESFGYLWVKLRVRFAIHTSWCLLMTFPTCDDLQLRLTRTEIYRNQNYSQVNRSICDYSYSESEWYAACESIEELVVSGQRPAPNRRCFIAKFVEHRAAPLILFIIWVLVHEYIVLKKVSFFGQFNSGHWLACFMSVKGYV